MEEDYKMRSEFYGQRKVMDFVDDDISSIEEDFKNSWSYDELNGDE